MTWLQGDVWQTEVMLPAGQRIEYKYVILEDQVRLCGGTRREEDAPVATGCAG